MPPSEPGLADGQRTRPRAGAARTHARATAVSQACAAAFTPCSYPVRPRRRARRNARTSPDRERFDPRPLLAWFGHGASAVAHGDERLRLDDDRPMQLSGQVDLERERAIEAR